MAKLLRPALCIAAAHSAVSKSLLFVENSSFEIASSQCEDRRYHGSYGQAPVQVFSAHDSCSQFRVLSDSEANLYSLELAAVEHLDAPENFGAYVDEHIRAALASQLSQSAPQQVFAATTAAQVQPLHHTSNQSFYYIPNSLRPYLSDILPPFVNAYVVPLNEDIPLPPKEEDKVEQRLEDYLKALTFDPLIDFMVDTLAASEFKKTLEVLSGEAGLKWRTRHSFTKDGEKAAKWIKDQVAPANKFGKANCKLDYHTEGFNPNVICTYKPSKSSAYANETVIISSHYDSRGSFGSMRAPGANDDASGVSVVLEFAKLIKDYDISFNRELILAFFSGEEQGLWGSRDFARRMREENRDIVFMLQVDEIGYQKPGEPMQIAFPNRFRSLAATQLAGNISELYAPELQVGITPACCSDQQSFNAYGYPVTWVFERNNPIADPHYHSSGDLVNREGYSIPQIRAIAKVVIASGLHMAKYHL